ncbi:MAG TPA: DMT family transporter [Nitrospirae bacterium]|nr:EamA-like transporter family protein [bacterium BMS3Abin08]HDO35697.1 DMT family transporter [Nitrospirota bacterium]
MASLYIVIAILIWSSLGLFVRASGVPVHVLIFYSALFSLFFQAPLFISRRFRSALPPLKGFPYIFLLSLCLLLNTFTFLFAYSKTTIANAVLTHYIAPVIVAVLAFVFLGERITPRIIFSIIVASAGLWIMLGGGAILECFRGVASEGFRVTGDLLGILSGLASGFFYALLVIFVRVFTQRMNPYMMVFFQNLFMVMMLLPFIREVPYERLWLLAVMGAVHSTAAPFFYYRGLMVVQASRAAVLGYLEPVGAIIFSIIFLKEFPGARSYVGGVLIILSGYLAVSEGRGKNSGNDS